MISVDDLVQFVTAHPSLHDNAFQYAFTGGTAIACWMSACRFRDRKHADIDVFAFSDDWLADYEEISLNDAPLFSGGFDGNKIVAGDLDGNIPIQIVLHRCLDAEVLPTQSDIRMIFRQGEHIPTLSAEYMMIAKLGFPNVHRQYDFWDAMMVNRCGCIEDKAYLSSLLMQTALGNYVTVSDIVDIITSEDLQRFLDNLHRQLIRQFLYWRIVQVEVLNYYQLFVLIDEAPQALDLPGRAIDLLNSVVGETRDLFPERELWKLGLCLILTALPNRGHELLDVPNIEYALRELIASARSPGRWLAHAKSTRTTLKRLFLTARKLNYGLGWIPTGEPLLAMINHLFLHPRERYALLSSLEPLLLNERSRILSAKRLTKILRPIVGQTEDPNER